MVRDLGGGAVGLEGEVGKFLRLLCLSERAEEEEDGDEEEAEAQEDDKCDEEVHHCWSNGYVAVGPVGARVVSDDESRKYSHCVE